MLQIGYSQYVFNYDSTANDLSCSSGMLHLYPNNFDDSTNTYDGNFLVLSAYDSSGNYVFDEIMNSVYPEDFIRIVNQDTSKLMSFIAIAASSLGTDRIRITYQTGSLTYSGPDGEGFNDAS